MLGPYKLVESLGHGGMAEVYRARRRGPGGFAKDVALKQILPQYSKNEELVQRFMEEARIAGALIHGNIVQVYDFGFFENQYYIAMEYIDGMSLAAILDRSSETGIPLPSPLVAFIGAEACSGLFFAHELTDDSGKHIELVHRDVGPQNILISFAGDIKIGDFGIVKAADSLVRTEAGLRLGKLNYMSPEQAAGDSLDGRSDLFALGITLWEALTLKPLLPRSSAPETFETLKHCDFPPPSKFRRDIPHELEKIVMRALARDRGSRFRDCEEMARVLRAFVHAVAPGFGRHDVVEYLDWLRPSEGRSTGVGPPVPHSIRLGQGTASSRSKNWLGWLALASAPVVGLLFGAGAFLGMGYLETDDDAPPQPAFDANLNAPLPSPAVDIPHVVPDPIVPTQVVPQPVPPPVDAMGAPPPIAPEQPGQLHSGDFENEEEELANEELQEQRRRRRRRASSNRSSSSRHSSRHGVDDGDKPDAVDGNSPHQESATLPDPFEL